MLHALSSTDACDDRILEAERAKEERNEIEERIKRIEEENAKAKKLWKLER